MGLAILASHLRPHPWKRVACYISKLHFVWQSWFGSPATATTAPKSSMIIYDWGVWYLPFSQYTFGIYLMLSEHGLSDIPKEWFSRVPNQHFPHMKWSKSLRYPPFSETIQQSGGKWNGSCRNASAADSTSTGSLARQTVFHGGWRFISGKLIEETVSSMKDFPAMFDYRWG